MSSNRLSFAIGAQANSSVITNAAPNAPQHGHLALTGVESEMLIQVQPWFFPHTQFYARSTIARVLAR